MQNRVVRVTPLPRYRLQIEFDDGVTGVSDLAGELTGPVFGPLRDEALFRQVTVDVFRAVGSRGHSSRRAFPSRFPVQAETVRQPYRRTWGSDRRHLISVSSSTERKVSGESGCAANRLFQSSLAFSKAVRAP